ncbi:binding-protein-dependent transporter inner membrane protein [Calothrix sp. NIES-4071]|nr:binding-protein-dependent transporter inner membrane protein [Calothrix sp. NIES-4071]BAZ55853.1 binding-protein-dependent transporter inner membrane protein [Calothrix sp. NIES-4105]
MFYKAILPQIITGVAASSFLVFITTLGDFVNPELLGGASSMTGAGLIYNQFLGATQNWGFGSALSMALINDSKYCYSPGCRTRGGKFFSTNSSNEGNFD